MTEPPTISVCMAAFNGQRYIEDQIRSILDELPPNSELIVVDDCSTDDTRSRVTSCEDSRIRMLSLDRNGGHVKAFETALEAARGSYVFLTDQDDLWPKGRVAAMMDGLSRSRIVVGNVGLFGEGREASRIPLRAADSTANVRNILGIFAGRRSYFGCATAIRADLLRNALPFPDYIEAHDHWLAILGNVSGSITHLDQVVTKRRLHSNNLTAARRRSARELLRTRIALIRSVLDAARRMQE